MIQPPHNRTFYEYKIGDRWFESACYFTKNTMRLWGSVIKFDVDYIYIGFNGLLDRRLKSTPENIKLIKTINEQT